MKRPLRREFASREDLVAYVRDVFPEATAVDEHFSQTRGGRQAAETALAEIDPEAYQGSRNYLDGAVTRLSPYIRHGVLGLAEAKRAAQEASQRGHQLSKLVQELAWRDFFQRIYRQIGRAIWRDREPYKTGFSATDYTAELPDDFRQGKTGLACIDAFARELIQTGYLHNHARMWLAGYVVHWRRVKWQAGARWFLTHLLDGDPASNNLSWQWVASTFSHKPYFFNRENVERFSGGRYCRQCPLYGHCPFEGTYEALERRLFPRKEPVASSRTATKSGKKKRRQRWHHD